MVVPGSGVVKRQAEEEGLDRIFTEAGFEWREAGCSMCLAMNPDKLDPGQRCASTSNRNFEGRQGKGGRTHLVPLRWPPLPQYEARLSTSATGTSNNKSLPSIICVSQDLENYIGCHLMDAFTVHTGVVGAMDRANVDTDQIIPKQFLKRIERTGFGQFLFYDWRFHDDGSENAEFELNQSEVQGASILAG